MPTKILGASLPQEVIAESPDARRFSRPGPNHPENPVSKQSLSKEDNLLKPKRDGRPTTADRPEKGIPRCLNPMIPIPLGTH